MDIIAVYPGSFDPITLGHLDIVERSKGLFSKVIIAVLQNPQKEALFSLEERVEMTREVCRVYPEVEVQSFDGLLVDFAEQMGARAIIRGLRAPTDFEYELQMALMNRRLNEGVETLFMVPRETHTFVSSSLAKEIASLGGSVEGLVPPLVEERLREKLAS
jgi:pantetheine-phosphate adenylyltransferase